MKKQKDMEFNISPAEEEIIEAITKEIDSGLIHINSKDPIADMTFLMFAVRCNQKGLAKWLIEKGINIDAQERADGLTALMIAVGNDNLDMVKLLLEAKANINIQSTCKEVRLTTLMGSVVQGNIEMVKLFIAHKLTALMGSVVQGNIEMVKLFIAHKPDLHITNTEGYTALMMAELMNKIGIAVLLREAEEQNSLEGKDE
jgi:ankyrin repeat protein